MDWALAYLAAFGSLAVQLDGLIGSDGILPAAEFLERTGPLLGTGPVACWRLPTVFWLSASDTVLHAVCWGGLLLGAALFCGFLPGFCAVLLWVSYLSLVAVGPGVSGLSVGFVTSGNRPAGGADGPVGSAARAGQMTSRGGSTIWLVRWLAFRLMFLSGVVKLATHDPTWQNWTALEYHYQTQPLPAWTSWYVHQMPAWFHGLSVGFMFYAELVAPFFVFGPRPIRLAGFASVLLLQLLIAATGNYGFFNVLAVVICLCILDDRDWEWIILRVVRHKDPLDDRASVDDIPRAPGKTWSRPRRLAVGVAGLGIMVVTATQTIGTVAPEFLIPSELLMLSQWVEPFRSTNSYGLFAVMTTTSPGDHRRGERRRRELDALPVPLETVRARSPAAVHHAAPAPARLADVVRGPGSRARARSRLVLPVRAQAAWRARPRCWAFCGKTRSRPIRRVMCEHDGIYTRSLHGAHRTGGPAKTERYSCRL